MSRLRMRGAVPPLVIALADAVFGSNVKYKYHLHRIWSIDPRRFLHSSSPLLLFTVRSVWIMYVCSIAMQRLISLATAIYSLKLFYFPHSQHIAVGKATFVQAWTDPEGSRRLRLPEFVGIWHLKVTRLTAVHTGRLYLQEILLVLIPVRCESTTAIVRKEKPQCPIGNRTCDLQPCSTLPRRMVGLQKFRIISCTYYIHIYVYIHTHTQ